MVRAVCLAQAGPLVRELRLHRLWCGHKKKKNVETKKQKRCDQRSRKASAEAPWGAFGRKGEETVAKVMAAPALPLGGTEGAKLLTFCRAPIAGAPEGQPRRGVREGWSLILSQVPVRAPLWSHCHRILAKCDLWPLSAWPWRLCWATAHGRVGGHQWTPLQMQTSTHPHFERTE